MIQHFSIKRATTDNNKFQVLFGGQPIVFRHYHDIAMTESSLVVDEDSIHSTFASAKQYIFDEEAEQVACEAEAAQERYIAQNYDECGRPFRCGDEW